METTGRVRRILGRRRIASVLVVAALAALVVPGAAYAGYFHTSQSSPCSPVISSGAGGGKGYARINYYAHRANTRKYVIEAAASNANSFQTCNQGNAVLPYRITTTQRFRFEGSSLSCSGGIDVSFPRGAGLSFSCTGSGSTVTESISTTCAIREPHCYIDQGYMEINAPVGAVFENHVWGQTSVVVRNAAGQTASWQTPWV